MSTLEQEVRTLQKQVRRQRRWNIGLGLMIVVGGLMAAKGIQEVPYVIEAKEFRVVNGEGKTQVLLSANTNGGSLTIGNKHGKAVAGIAADPDGGVLSISNKDGKPVAGITADADGDGVLETINAKGVVTNRLD